MRHFLKGTILGIMVMLLITSLSVAFYVQQGKAQEQGLIAYFPLNGNVNDESENDHDGTVTGATSAIDRFGKPISAYSFDGSDDYAEVPHDADFNFGAGSFTVSAWIKSDATTGVGSGRDDILAKGDPTISGFAISIRNNKAAFWIGGSGEFFGSSVLNDGEWHQIVGTRDDSGDVALYVDGVSECTGNNIESVDTGYSIFIGKHGTVKESYFDGLIDDVRIYNRVLMEIEIQELYDVEVKDEHELVVSLDALNFLQPSGSSLLNATVYNRGLSNEKEVELHLIIDSVRVRSTTIAELLNGTSYTLSYLWTPTVGATYNVTAYSPPVSGENFRANNIEQIIVIVAKTFAGNVYIKADGSVDPLAAPISSLDRITYTFTADINGSLVVGRDNLVIDGAGYTLQGKGSEDGLDVSQRCNVTIKNTEIKSFEQGIMVSDATNITINGNNITANNNGIWVGSYSSNITINRNNITANNNYGIELDLSSHNTICENNIAENKGSGIDLYEHSYFNTILKNNITHNGGGIAIVGDSSYNSISRNTVTSNEFGIIIIEVSNYNLILGNNFTNNVFGIGLAGCLNNTIYHNIFDNLNETLVEYTLNIWDDGYPSGGNYWSDHVCTGNPSDGSQPYIIDENNIDHYPFQDPSSWITLTIDTKPPVADAGSDQTVNVNEEVNFDAGGSSDNVEIVSYEWDFGDGTTGSGVTTTHTYNEAGIYIVTLTLKDVSENVNTDSLMISVQEKEVPEEEKKGCIIATATYGSELSTEVQVLRGFRDKAVLNTFAGSSFMTTFNAWYYFFSPRVASTIAANEALRSFMKILLYPLIEILRLAATTHSLLRFNQELAVVTSGMVASSLIGVVYFSPLMIMLFIFRRRLGRTSAETRLPRLLAVPWLTSVILLLLGEITASSTMMMAATAVFVLATIAISSTITATLVMRALHPPTR